MPRKSRILVELEVTLELERQNCSQKASKVGTIAHILEEDGGRPSPLATSETKRAPIPHEELGRYIRAYEPGTWPPCNVGCHKHPL